MQNMEQVQPCKAEVHGVSVLELRVVCPGLNENAHAVREGPPRPRAAVAAHLRNSIAGLIIGRLGGGCRAFQVAGVTGNIDIRNFVQP